MSTQEFIEQGTSRFAQVEGHTVHYNEMGSGQPLLKRMPNGRMHIFPRCGHWVQLEKSAEFEVLLTAFLAEQ
jgi:4,5:9,10-diseco-3-hydroxy-5,9,17-trioxoandrosta-1(10),2-diene-4-oate hydrolase